MIVRDLIKILANAEPNDKVYVKFGHYHFPVKEVEVHPDESRTVLVMPNAEMNILVLDPLETELAKLGMEYGTGLDLNDPRIMAYYDKIMNP